jgi:hypothetical protein
MLETFLILLAGGVMLAAAVPDPESVTLHWLRLAGILALSFAGLSTLWFGLYGSVFPELRGMAIALLIMTIVFVMLQLAFTQVGWPGTQRIFACAAALSAVETAVLFLQRDRAHLLPARYLSAAGVAAMCGLALMDMLLGHAYLTAAKMTIAPFLRLNRALIIVLIVRTFSAVAIAHFVNQAHPVEHLWGIYGLYIGTRWFVGLLVPAVFLYMAHDCIKRRSTQSATGILYVAGVLIFIGEIVALHLLRETGLPF